MSLQVWLPLNGNLQNKGLSDIDITNSGATVNNTGKIGKCYSFAKNAYLRSSTSSLNLSNYKEISSCFWIKINSWNTNWDTVMQIGPGSTPWTSYLFGVLRNSGSSLVFTIGDGTNSSQGSYYSSNLTLGVWYHLSFIYKAGKCLIYIDGKLDKQYNTTIVPNFSTATYLFIGGLSSNYKCDCLLNDVRIYDHALSLKEIKEISKGLVLHYPLDKCFPIRNQNLFRNSSMKEHTNLTATTPLRYYNGSASNHTFTETNNGYWQDTILLNSNANLGIAFNRLASQINLDSSSYYTISCEAKCTRSANLCIGLSYYKDASTPVWREGSNPKAFTAINTWQKFTLTFKPDTDTYSICYCFTVNPGGVTTDTFTIRKCKLEKGIQATEWQPSPEDSQIIQIGYNENIIYDQSGYKNNGQIINTITYSSDTPKYSVSTHIGATNQKIHISNFPTSGFGNSYSFAWWGKRSSNSPMFWGFSNGIRLNGMYIGYLWNTGDGSNNPLYYINTTTQVTPPSVNTWHHYVMTGNGIKCYVYLDGQLWAEAKTYKSISGDSIYINGWDSGTSYCSDNMDISDFRIYSTALTEEDVRQLYQTSAIADRLSNFYIYKAIEENQKEISRKNLSYFSNYIETSAINPNIMPNSVTMALGSANASSGTWRTAGTNNMTRSRVLISDSPIGECYGFQSAGIQPETINDNSCYGIDSFPFQVNTDYVISFWARKTTGTEGYAGCAIYNCTYGEGTDIEFKQRYYVSKLPESGEWFRYWKQFKTNSSTNRNIYIGITTGESSATVQMCAVKIEKGKYPTNWTPKETDSDYEQRKIKDDTIAINRQKEILSNSFIQI